MRIPRRGLLAGAASLAVPSCRAPLPAASARAPADEWTSHGCDLAATRNNAAERLLGEATVGKLAPVWELEAGSGITGTPAIAGDVAVVGSWDGIVYAVDLGTGAKRWTSDVGTRTYPTDRRLGVFASVAIAGGTVYVASDRIVALDLASGRKKWERTIGDPDSTREYFWAPPIAHGGRVFAGVSAGSETETRGRVVSLDAATGEVAWTFFTVEPEVAGGGLLACPSLDPSTMELFVTTGNPFHLAPGPLLHTCSLVALDATTGRLAWADQVHPHDEKNLDLNCPPMLDGARIVGGGKDGLRAWDRKSHARLWHVALTPAHAPDGAEALPTTGPEAGPTALAGGMAFFASNAHATKSSVIAAIDAVSGGVRWRRELPAFQFGPPSVANGVVYIGLVDGKLRAFRARDGEPLWESPPGEPIAGGPSIARGTVLVGSGAGPFLPGKKLRAYRVA